MNQLMQMDMGTGTAMQTRTAPPVITTIALDDADEGVVYSDTLAATGIVTAWSITAGTLPDGLTLNAGTGEISGTPTTAGTVNITVRATGPGGFDEVELTLTVNAALESFDWAGDGSDMADLGGTGGDITTKFSGGKLGVTPSPLHGVFDQQTPASGKFDLTVVMEHTAADSTHWLGGINFLMSDNARRKARYGSGEQNKAANDQGLILEINGGALDGVGGLTGEELVLTRYDDSGYTPLATYALATLNNGTPHTIVIHVDATGATPLVSVDLDGVEVIAETDCGAGTDSYGRYLGLYCEGSGSGTTPLANNTVDSVSWEEVA